ncbi:CBN-PCH-2 protein [Aphelenchoides avenae]|nr:CBN-PCH-2 protein [Aphelenchus avenae]
MGDSIASSSYESLSGQFEKIEIKNETAANDSKPSCSVFLEVRIKKGVLKTEVQKLTGTIIESLEPPLWNWRAFTPNHPELVGSVDQILVGSQDVPDGEKLDIEPSSISPDNVHIYAAKTGGAMAQEISATEGSKEFSIGSHQWEIPCNEFDDIWQNLVYDDNIKERGPPGTGKTSLCKALAQRLSVRLGRRYKRSIFIEVNSHSLFSKWFSESGKLIHRLFEQIEELAEERTWLVYVLLDEVESLTMGRNSAFSGTDPSDSVRAVNSILTQLDKIRRYPNVLLLTTSNITGAIDSAFMDRTDICRYIGLPSEKAICAMLESALKELHRVDIVQGPSGDASFDELFAEYSDRLMAISKQAVGLSGRSIRKLPVLAYSKSVAESLSMDSFLDKLECVIKEKLQAHGHSKSHLSVD